MDKNTSITEDSTPQKEEFKCPDCDQVFAQKRSLLRHDFAVHWGQKHICNCGKQFPRKDSLKRHRRGCPGVLIQGTIVNITPYNRPASTTQENTLSTPKAGHSLQQDYIIRKKICTYSLWMMLWYLYKNRALFSCFSIIIIILYFHFDLITIFIV